MDAIRRIVTAKDIVLQVLLPETFRNKQLEIIILPTEDTDEVLNQHKKFDFTQLYGKLKSGMGIDEIDEKIKQMRSEWD
jgi:hypothetical protein